MMQKKFDCVKMMRDIRKKVSKEMENFSTQEKIRYLDIEMDRFKKENRSKSRNLHQP